MIRKLLVLHVEDYTMPSLQKKYLNILVWRNHCSLFFFSLVLSCIEYQGLVYTWGCSDDGSLGRIGDESMPGLVEVWLCIISR